MNDQRARMAAMSGDSGGGKAPRYRVPLIKFDGNTGEFRKIDPETKDATPLPKQIEIVILKNRKKLEDYDSGLSTNEFNGLHQKVTLFKSDDGKFSRVAVDVPTVLKEDYPTLKTQEVLYVLFEGEICQLVVKGGSSTNFYSYRDVLKDLDQHTFEVMTVVGSESAKNPKNKKSYYRMTFTNSDLSMTLDVVEENMNVVNENLKKIDDYNTQKLLDYAKEKGGYSAPAGLKKDPFDSDDDSIDANDIPFE
jgi:hypothetical protein